MPARPRHFPSVIEVGSYSIIADDSFPDVEIITGEKEQPKNVGLSPTVCKTTKTFLFRDKICINAYKFILIKN